MTDYYREEFWAFLELYGENLNVLVETSSFVCGTHKSPTSTELLCSSSLIGSVGSLLVTKNLT